MGQSSRDLHKRIEDFFVSSTGRLSYPMCCALLESEYRTLAGELKGQRPDATVESDPDLARLEEARANIQAQLDRYETINRRWNRPISPSGLRQRLP